MKKLLFTLFLIGAVITASNSCRHEPLGTSNTPGNYPDPGTQPPVVSDIVCDADTVYFQNKVLPLLISNCAKSNCHDAVSRKKDVELTSYSTIMATADVDPFDPAGSEIYRVLNETDPEKVMPRPPNTPLTVAEKNLIYTWILQGAKNNVCNDCDTTSITYATAVVPIVNTNCKGCHNPAFLSAGLDLTSYATMRSIALNGKLNGVINHLPGYRPMPRGGAKLNDCRITQITRWIDAGAQNN